MTDTPQKPRPRRWRTFKLSTLLLAIGVIALGLGVPHIWHYVQFQRFKSFAGKDLDQFSDNQRNLLQDITQELIFDENANYRTNRFLGNVTSAGSDRTLLIQGFDFYCTDIECMVYPYLFNGSGNLVVSTSFSIGYEITLENARIVPDSPFPEIAIFAFDTCPMIHLHSTLVRKQYYGIVADEIILLRLEDDAGKLVPNVDFRPVGPEPIQRTTELWLSGLRASNQVEVLRSLNWLAYQKTLPEDAVATVTQLTTSKNAWIAEAAQQIITPRPDSRFELFRLTREESPSSE